MSGSEFAVNNMKAWLYLALCQQFRLQADGGLMVYRMLCCHTLGSLVPTKDCLNTTAYPSFVVDPT